VAKPPRTYLSVEPITSPTFTLAREYDGDRLTLHHLDVYRLEQIDEVLDLALPELLDSASVTLIEWGDAIIPALPAEYLEIRLEYGDDYYAAFVYDPDGNNIEACYFGAKAPRK